MINEITYEEVPRNIYRRGFVFVWPPGTSEDLYFSVDEDVTAILKKYDSVGDYIHQVKDNPRGINLIKPIDNNGNYIIVAYNKKEISREAVGDYLRSLFTKEIQA